MFGNIYESWFLAMALMDEAKRKDQKRMEELDREEVNRLYYR